MLCYIQPDPWVFQKPRDLNPLQFDTPTPQPGRERSRHLVIGSPEGVRETIHTLHVRHYRGPNRTVGLGRNHPILKRLPGYLGCFKGGRIVS
ncbi:MAG: hypothetical protein ACFCVD_16940 [Nodosilinea sp.]